LYRNFSRKAARSKYGFEPFYDKGSTVSRELEMYRVPMKLFLEDGIIKRRWLGSADDDGKRAELKDWLNSL
jgi:hypothetical protein